MTLYKIISVKSEILGILRWPYQFLESNWLNVCVCNNQNRSVYKCKLYVYRAQMIFCFIYLTNCIYVYSPFFKLWKWLDIEIKMLCFKLMCYTINFPPYILLYNTTDIYKKNDRKTKAGDVHPPSCAYFVRSYWTLSFSAGTWSFDAPSALLSSRRFLRLSAALFCLVQIVPTTKNTNQPM